jgi:hypothetical protein
MGMATSAIPKCADRRNRLLNGGWMNTVGALRDQAARRQFDTK